MTSIHELSSSHQMAIEAMKSQLIIVLVQRLGGRVEVPAAEIDATGSVNLMMAVDDKTRAFTFEVAKK